MEDALRRVQKFWDMTEHVAPGLEFAGETPASTVQMATKCNSSLKQTSLVRIAVKFFHSRSILPSRSNR